MADEPKKPDPSKIVAMPLDRARRARGEGVVAMPRSKVASLRAFRRIRADRFFGALGALLVILGVLLIFVWEKPPDIPKTFSIEWTPSTTSLTTEALSLTTAQPTKAIPLTVPGPNVTAVTFWFSWKDDVGNEGSEADEFSFEVKGPSGANLTLPAEKHILLQGNISRTYLMSGVPELSSVPAKTESEARAKVGDQTNQTGIGTYEFTFRLISLNGDWTDNSLRDRAPCNSPYCTPDNEHKMTFHFEFATYSATYKRNF